MARASRLLLFLGLAALLSLPLSCVTVFWMNTPSHDVLLELQQPTVPDYQSSGPYSVYVLSGSRRWNSLGLERRHEIVVAPSGEYPPSYGHWLEYTFHASGSDPSSHIQQSKAEWTAAGVTFVEASGHRLFIPKAMFIGGR